MSLTLYSCTVSEVPWQIFEYALLIHVVCGKGEADLRSIVTEKILESESNGIYVQYEHSVAKSFGTKKTYL